jgi:hypothetical protein
VAARAAAVFARAALVGGRWRFQSTAGAPIGATDVWQSPTGSGPTRRYAFSAAIAETDPRRRGLEVL